LWRDANRVTSFLRQCVRRTNDSLDHSLSRLTVGNQPGILVSDHFVRFGQQCRFERRSVPDRAANE
jgi:hypothetical protein